MIESNKYILLAAVFAGFLLNGCTKSVTASQKHIALESAAEYKSQMVIFQGEKTVVSEWFKAQQAEVLIEAIDPEENLYLAKYKSERSPVQVSEALTHLKLVEFAEPNYILHKQDVPPVKDPLGLQQWAVLNIGQDSPRGLQGIPGADIDVIEAWAKVREKLGAIGSKEVIVGVIDTGIDYTHPELKDNMWINEAERNGIAGEDDDGNGYADDIYGWNFITDSQRHKYFGQLGHFDPLDDHGHGTHCAGIIGAKGGNYKGVMGINWTIRLMALKFLDEGGSGATDDAYRAIKYGIANGAHILSNSWGGGGPSDAMRIIVKKAEAAGVLFVAAAGNSAENADHKPHFPSSYESENVLSVAATDNRDRIATFSNYGFKAVDIAAPGVDIMSTYPVNGDLPSRAYRSFSGTSMATPMVAGAAALLMAYKPELRFKAVEVKKILMETSDRITMLEGKVSSGGRLNVNRAILGDKNEIETFSEDDVVAEDLDIKSPRYPEEMVDQKWVIQKEGALQTRVFFKEIEMDIPQYDLLALYNLSHKHIFSIESPVVVDMWTPWVEDSGVIVRFANAKVELDVIEWQEFHTQREAQRSGATDCRASLAATGGVRCKVSVGIQTYANYESLGFHITQAEFRMKGSK
jgi:thermitase